MKAYIVSEDFYGHCDAVFAETPGKAKMRADLDVEFTEMRCRREPEWDKYAPGPVPTEAMVDKGWWFSCHGDGCLVEMVHADDPESGEIIDGDVYCVDCAKKQKCNLQ